MPSPEAACNRGQLRGDEVTASCDHSDRLHVEEIEAVIRRHEAASEKSRDVCQGNHPY